MAIGITLFALIPLVAAWKDSPSVSKRNRQPFMPYLFNVPSATAAVLVFGAVETGLYALLPVFGARIGQSTAETAWIMSLMGLGNVVFQIPLGFISDRMGDRRILLAIIALCGLAGMLALPLVSESRWMLATLLFFWGGMIAGLYTVGLAHLGTKVEPHELASANAAFVACYALGMILGPQLIGMGMDLAGPAGFSGVISAFFAIYLALVSFRLAYRNRRG
jgi:predicted MFS family arabinose efflux permease